MILTSETRRSDLFNTLAWMGLLSTEERRIRTVREGDVDLYQSLDLTYDDIERVGYYYPHVAIRPDRKKFVEMWVGDTYLNPAALQWIDGNYASYAIVNERYDELTPVKCFYNPSIIYRYSNVADNDTTEYCHTKRIDITDLCYSEIRHIERCAFYISQNKVCVPEVEWIDEKTLQFRAPYKHDIDFFMCSNVVNVVKVEAGKGVYIDQPHSNYCYHRMIVDHDATYPIDARFYPCVTVDKDCVIRVYSDNYHTILYPDACRLLLYPEFLDVEDPYNTDNEYLKNLQPVEELITSDDSDEEIIEKFSKIAAICYRMWEKYPIDTTMHSDFLICDNARLSNKNFYIDDVYTEDGVQQMILSAVPFEPFRDMILYNGMMFSDYRIIKTRKLEGKHVESPIGTAIYAISTEYDPDKLTIIKFNTAEDTVIMNIGEYIDTNNVAKLHYKLNRFFRNLLVIRQQVLDVDIDSGDKVRIATVRPTAKDKYIWFELLVNAVPEMFATRPIESINLMGLDPDAIPDEIREGAYALELDPEDGPVSYSELLLTYFKLNADKKKYLALQYGDGVDDPRIQVFHDLRMGRLIDNEEMNALVIEDDSPNKVITEYEQGRPDNPGTKDKTPNDLYVQRHGEPPHPGEENIEIDKFVMGPNKPDGDEHALWVDNSDGTEPLPGKDTQDAETEVVNFANDKSSIQNPSKGTYVVENQTQSFTEDEEGQVPVSDLLKDENDPTNDGEPDIDDLLGDGEQTDTDIDESIDNLLSGLTDAIASNRTVDSVVNPEIGALALDNIQFCNSETGEAITMEEIAALPTEIKVNLVSKLITDDDNPNGANVGDLWVSYLSTSDPMLLNTVVYKILLTKHVYDLSQLVPGSLAIEGDDMPEAEEGVEIGPYQRWVKPDHMLIQPMDTDEEGNVVPDYDMIRKQAVKYIMSIGEPENVQKDDLWFSIPAAILSSVILDVISHTIFEGGYDLPAGVKIEDDQVTYETMALDFFAHDHGTPEVGELFQEVDDPTLHRIFYGESVDVAKMKDDDVWFEFLDTINNKVAYSDENSMVIRVDERLIMLKFEHNNIQAFAFDDIFLNFRGKLGIKYLSIIADLMNSHEIGQDDINVFYKRLITAGDDLDPRLKRLYTGTSHVVSTAKIDTTDYAILYSTNIGRFQMDYSSPDMSNREREAAYRMVIDYSHRDFAFLNRRMILFVNGKYIPYSDYTEDFAGKIQLKNFNEIIATVDILYSKKDKMLMDLKRTAYKYWPIPDTSKSIQRPSHYGIMEPIRVIDYTKRGYYDVLLDEYIFNGKLMRILNYLEEHPEEAEDFRRDIIQKFHAISDLDLDGATLDTARIIIPGLEGNDESYQVGQTG